MSGVRGSRLTSIVALVLVAVAAAFTIVLVFRPTVATVDRPVAPPRASPTPSDPIVATATLDTPVVLFGDTLTANVDVVVDGSAIDPESIDVKWDSTPWTAVEPPRRTLEQAGATAHVRMTYVLRCLAAICAPARETERVYFAPVRVTYAAASGSPATRGVSQRIPWRTLIVHSRIGDAEPGNGAGIAPPWRVNLDDFPPVSTHVGARAEILGLGGIGLLFLFVAAVVLYRAWPRHVPEPEPEPEPESEPVVSALEQALAWLEGLDDDGSDQRRRALELVADEVERVGDRELALRARALAWSNAVPHVERTRELASHLRVRLASVLELEAASTNGADPERKHNGAS